MFSGLELIGILTTIVGIPVFAHNVDTTAESIPPDIPTTNVDILFSATYDLIHSCILRERFS